MAKKQPPKKTNQPDLWANHRQEKLEEARKKFEAEPPVKQEKPASVEKSKPFVIKAKGPLLQQGFGFKVEVKPKEERVTPIEVKRPVRVTYNIDMVVGLTLKAPFVDGYSRKEWLEDLENFYKKYPNT